MSTERFVVDESIADAFVEKFVAKAATLAAGDPAVDPSCVIGPMVTSANGPRLNDMIDDAVAKGAEVVLGGRADGAAMPATIVDKVSPTMTIYDEETFGPITTVVRVSGAEEAAAPSSTSSPNSNGSRSNRPTSSTRSDRSSNPARA